VPRTGGSNLEDYLAARFGPLTMLDRDWMRAWARRGWRHDSLVCSPQHVTAADAARLLPAATFLSFAVVRDPVARAVSEFRFQSRRGFRRRRLTQLGFSTWLRVALAATRRDPRIFDNHLRPQSDIVPLDAEVFRLEDGFDALIARLDAISDARAPELVIADEREPHDCSVRLSRQDLSLLAVFYAEDYARFDYPKPTVDGAFGDLAAPVRDAFARALGPTVTRMYFRGTM
jgi:hypothetical protein